MMKKFSDCRYKCVLVYWLVVSPLIDPIIFLLKLNSFIFPFFQSSAPNSGEKNLFLEEISWHTIILLPYNFASLDRLDIFQFSSKSFFFLSHHCINSIYYGLVFIKMSFNQLYKKAFIFHYYILVNISMSLILWSSEIDQIPSQIYMIQACSITKAIIRELLTEHFQTIFVHTFCEIGGV